MLGFAMLWGRLDVRLAGRTFLGLFILFGAPLIASELMPLRAEPDFAQPDIVYQENERTPPKVPHNAPVNDPYAGAAVPHIQ